MKERIEDFLKFLEVDKQYAENTIAAYQNDLGQFLDYIESKNHNGIQKWTGVNDTLINNYIKYLKNSTYSSSTVARKAAAIKSFFKFLVAEGDLKDAIVESLDAPKVKKRLPKAMMVHEVDRLLKAPSQGTDPKAYRDKALLELLYASGMRVTELVSLNVSDVDINEDEESDSLVRVKGKKSHAKERKIPLLGSALETVKHYINQARVQMLQSPDEDALFLNNRGQRLTRQGLWLIIKHYVEMVGISTKVTPHTLRHSFAAHKLSQGKSLQDIQRLLGHANISTTQVYAQMDKKRKTEAQKQT